MKIEAVETVRHPDHPNLLHVLVRAEDGTVGLGETFFDAEAVEAHVHESVAPRLIGTAAYAAPSLPVPAGPMRSPESSALSAVDIALYDLRARGEGVPLHALLGGAARQAAPAYVTCIDPSHPGEDWGLGVPGGSAYRDFTAALERPAELAHELVTAGFRGAKLFPFSRLDAETGGEWISEGMLEENVAPFRAMREAEPQLELFCDLASGWSYEPALAIARALEPCGLTWLEDPLVASDLDGLARLREAVPIPLAGHETRAGVGSFAELLSSRAVSVVHVDVQWCGGLTEAVRVGDLAGEHGLPVAFHDCAGPVAWAASLAAALALPNASWLECARPYALDGYPRMVSGVPELRDGQAWPAGGAGHGMALRPGYLAAAAVTRTPG
jgi:galactonate dehydratase